MLVWYELKFVFVLSRLLLYLREARTPWTSLCVYGSSAQLRSFSLIPRFGLQNTWKLSVLKVLLTKTHINTLSWQNLWITRLRIYILLKLIISCPVWSLCWLRYWSKELRRSSSPLSTDSLSCLCFRCSP